MYKAKDLRDRSPEELETMYQESCQKLFHLNSQNRTQQKSNHPHEAKHARKDIARLLTVMTEKRRQKQMS